MFKAIIMLISLCIWCVICCSSPVQSDEYFLNGNFNEEITTINLDGDTVLQVRETGILTKDVFDYTTIDGVNIWTIYFADTNYISVSMRIGFQEIKLTFCNNGMCATFLDNGYEDRGYTLVSTWEE